MSRRNIIIGVIVLVLLVAAGGFLLYQQNNAARTVGAARQTATLSRGELVASVSGAGNIYSPEQATLSFGVSGVPVTKLNVKVGDKVKAGDVLAEVDGTQLQQQLQTAQSNLASAHAKLDALASPADQLTLAQLQVKSAQSTYDSAVAKLDTLKNPSATALQAAQAQLASAQASFDAAAAKSGMTNDQVTVARASLEKARIALEAAQAAYNAIAWRDSAPSSSQATTLQQATIDYESAQASYNLAMADINNGSVKSAEAALAQAKTTLANLVHPTADTLASAQSAVDSASQSLMQAQQGLKALQSGGPSADTLAAQASVNSARDAVDQAKRALDTGKLIASFDGTVADIKAFVGQISSAGTAAITLVNTNNLQVQVSLSEVDVAQIKPGQQVQLSFDALGGRTFPGKVLSVSPLGTITQGVVNYSVTLNLTNPNPAILPGMTAQASIITADRANALLAPNRAVRTQGNRRTLTVLHEGNEIPLLIQTGLTNDQNTEILGASLSDGTAFSLQEGDTVVLNTTTTNANQRGGGGGGFIFGGGPGR